MPIPDTAAPATLPSVLTPLVELDQYEAKEQHNAWQVRCLDCSSAWSMGKKRLANEGLAFLAALLQHAEGHPHLVYVSWDLGRPWHIAYVVIPTRAVCGLAMPHPNASPPGWPKTTDQPDNVHRECSDNKPVGGTFRRMVRS